ncbi:hypothetical protein OSB04_018685 [Centaurea solstitialis]|uniref:Uncharacterized protein n=1 Tax=Centaurea solstitialis TaxID=347529 RepID=A0AA38T599_9ASTR|nr:hypothetical protein OSB04_018685 [Centaurea solstitialis]
MTNPVSLKDMHKTFAKLEKFSGQDFRRWQKKMHFYLTDLKVVYVLSTPCPAAVENEALEQTRNRSKWENADYICRGHILNGMSDSLFDVYQNVESAKELWDRLEAKYMAEDVSSKKFLVDTRPVMEQYHELQRILGQFAQYEELTLVELGSHFQIEQSIRDMEKVSVGGTKTVTGSSVNMVEEGESSKAGKGKQKFHGSNNKGSNKKPKVTCWKCGKPGHFNKDCRSGKGGGKGKNEAGPSGSNDPGKQSGMFLVPTDHSVENYYVSMISESFYVQHDDVSWWVDSGATCHEVELYHGVKIKTLRTDRGGEYYDPVYFQSTGIIHQTTAPYTPQQNGVSERKNRTLKEMVNSIVPNKRKKITPYELWHKKVPKLSYLRVWGCRAVVRLTDPKINNIGQRGIDCVFIGYPENSKCYRFYVIESNDYVSVHSVIESRDADFGNEDRFTSLPKPADMIASSSNFGTSDPVTVSPPEPSLGGV